MMLDANKAYLQTGLHVAQMFIGESGTIFTHTTAGDFADFVANAATYLDQEQSSSLCRVNFSEVVRCFNSEQESSNSKFDEFERLAQEVGVPKAAIDSARTAHEKAKDDGGEDQAGEALITAIEQALVIFTSSLGSGSRVENATETASDTPRTSERTGGAVSSNKRDLRGARG